MNRENFASDYSLPENWLFAPPENKKAFDAFYLYPTSWFPRTGENALCELSDERMRRAAATVFSVQASALFPVANVFAPYYRQFCAEEITSGDVMNLIRCIRKEPLSDVASAFDYFIKNLNGGRPFVLVSHSQGSSVMKELIKDYMRENPDVYGRMIAAYLIGFGITEKEISDFPHLKFAEKEDDTGVIISYNTEAPGEKGVNFTAPEGSLVINPINWKRDETHAAASENLGSVITGNGRLCVMKNFADARIDLKRGTLICETADKKEFFTPPPLGTFHSFDFGFYYLNLRQNILKRATKFFDITKGGNFS